MKTLPMEEARVVRYCEPAPFPCHPDPLIWGYVRRERPFRWSWRITSSFLGDQIGRGTTWTRWGAWAQAVLAAQQERPS